MKSPKEIGQELLKIVAKASGTKRRHDYLLSQASIDRQNYTRTFAGYGLEEFTDFLDKNLKPDEGLIITHQAFANIVGGITPTEFDMSAWQPILSRSNLALAPIYKLVGTQNIAVFMVIHRKLYQAIEYADELRSIITQKPVTDNRKSWLVGVAIKVSEEFGTLFGKGVTSITKYDILDGLNLLKDDEVYYISYNFCNLNRLDPRELIDYLGSKHFFISKLTDERMRNDEPNEAYKDIAEIVGVLVSKSEDGIKLGQENLKTLFKCSEHIDVELQKAKLASDEAAEKAKQNVAPRLH
jgi:hypothetical protein